MKYDDNQQDANGDATHNEKDKTHVVNDLRETETGRTLSEATSSQHSFTEKQQKRIMRRIDCRVVVLLGAMYAASLIDRSQIGLAMITGMGKDLQLNGTRYNTINAVFFAPYVILQLPATVLLRKIGPKRFLSATTMLWGMTTLVCGFVREWTDLVALRVVLGICEAGFLPGCIYLLSVWYPRYGLQKRNAGLLILGLVPAAFSGILAFGISHLEGHGTGPTWWGSFNVKTMAYDSGLAGWRWIFILYGIATCVIAILSWFLLVDFPEKIVLGTAQKSLAFLSRDEAAWAVEQIEKDRKDVMPTEFKLSEYLKHALDINLWAFALLYCFAATVGYGIGFALPFILMQGMRFSLAVSQCLVTPPYVLSAVLTWYAAYYADKWRLRSPFILVNSCLVIIGLCLLGFVKNVGVRYFAVFLTAIPGIANAPCILTWQANNVRGQWKRALVSALSVGFGAIGGIIGSLVFRTRDLPGYHPGIVTCVVAMTLTIVIVLLLDLRFMRANQRAAAGGKLVEGLAGFRYTL
ncbi:putative major facilitator superfamily, MFS transporter superfamily [Septoria linicola]|nr:putative major facilitator superfamily, MFS transporter superfamily [Septoria linicola]